MPDKKLIRRYPNDSQRYRESCYEYEMKKRAHLLELLEKYPNLDGKLDHLLACLQYDKHSLELHNREKLERLSRIKNHVMTNSDWDYLTEEEQQEEMKRACETKSNIEIGCISYSVDVTIDEGKYRLLPPSFFRWLRQLFH